MATATIEKKDVLNAYLALIQTLDVESKMQLLHCIMADLKITSQDVLPRGGLLSLKGSFRSDSDYNQLRSDYVKEKYGV